MGYPGEGGQTITLVRDATLRVKKKQEETELEKKMKHPCRASLNGLGEEPLPFGSLRE